LKLRQVDDYESARLSMINEEAAKANDDMFIVKYDFRLMQ